MQFFASIQFTSVAGAAADWYFTPEDEHGHKHVQHMPLGRAISRTLRFHTGTMAVGAFIVALVQMVRDNPNHSASLWQCSIFGEFVPSAQVKFFVIYTINQIQAQSPENKMIQFLGNCLKVIISCLERFIRFLGHLAYIETAIYGKNFCLSLLKAFKRLIKVQWCCPFVLLRAAAAG